MGIWEPGSVRGEGLLGEQRIKAWESGILRVWECSGGRSARRIDDMCRKGRRIRTWEIVGLKESPFRG